MEFVNIFSVAKKLKYDLYPVHCFVYVNLNYLESLTLQQEDINQ